MHKFLSIQPESSPCSSTGSVRDPAQGEACTPSKQTLQLCWVYRSLWTAAICILPPPLAVQGSWLSLCWTNTFECLQESILQTPELPSGHCLEKYQKVWRGSVRAKYLHIPKIGTLHQTQNKSACIFWKNQSEQLNLASYFFPTETFALAFSHSRVTPWS